jgi:hypothetical protein
MLSLLNSLCFFALLMTINAVDVNQDQQNKNQSVDVVNKTINKLIDLCKLFEDKRMHSSLMAHSLMSRARRLEGGQAVRR